MGVGMRAGGSGHTCVQMHNSRGKRARSRSRSVQQARAACQRRPPTCVRGARCCRSASRRARSASVRVEDRKSARRPRARKDRTWRRQARDARGVCLARSLPSHAGPPWWPCAAGAVGRTQRRRATPAPAHLVLHQRDQRRHHQHQARPHRGHQAVAQRLAAACMGGAASGLRHSGCRLQQAWGVRRRPLALRAVAHRWASAQRCPGPAAPPQSHPAGCRGRHQSLQRRGAGCMLNSARKATACTQAAAAAVRRLEARSSGGEQLITKCGLQSSMGGALKLRRALILPGSCPFRCLQHQAASAGLH